MTLLIPLFTLFTFTSTWFDAALGSTRLGLVTRRNQTRRQAVRQVQTGQYARALASYRFLVSTSSNPSLAERINLGHLYYRTGNVAAAKQQYEQPGNLATPALEATAATQLGLLAISQTKDTANALSYFQKALLNDPDNNAARANYELLKLHFSGKKPKTNLPKTAPKPTPAAGQRTQQTDQQRDQLTRQPPDGLTTEEATRLLDALQADDLPYILAQRRASKRLPGNNAGRW